LADWEKNTINRIAKRVSQLERRFVMSRFLGVVLVLVLAVGALGYYRGWFSFSKTTDQGNVHIGVTVDKQKIEADEEAAKKKLKETEQEIKDKVKTSSDKSK
jgi:hypothetical protein